MDRLTRQLLWLTGGAGVLSFIGIAIFLAPLEPEDLQRFRRHLPMDFGLLGCYGGFGYLVATRSTLFSQYAPGARRAVALVTPVAAVFDAAENALHWWLTSEPRFDIAPIYFISATISSVKWLLLLGFALAALRSFARKED